MGGERRRRRLRQNRDTHDPPAGSDPGGEPGIDVCGEATGPQIGGIPRTGGVRRRPAGRASHRAGPSPADLAGLSDSFASTAGVQDPEADAEPAADRSRPERPSDRSPPERNLPEKAPPADHRFDDPAGERGLRGLVGGGSSQVEVTAAMRARDAARPTDADLATADAELPIIRRGWVPRDELPRNP